MRFLLVAAMLFSLGLGAGCSGDDDDEDEPEIVETSGGLGGGGSGAQPEIVRGAGDGETGFTIARSAPSRAVPAGEASLTLRHTESATVSADRAFVVTVIESRPPGPNPFSGLSSRDRADVIAALTDLGIEEDAVTFEAGQNYGPFPVISVEMAVDDLPERGQSVIDAIEGILGRVQSGVSFGVSDCATALTPLREAALAVTHESAKSLAGAASLQLSGIIALTETTTSPIGPPTIDPCNRPVGAGFAPFGWGGLQPLEAEPEARLSVTLSVTYGVGTEPPSGASVIATGRGSATARANEAYIVASIQLNYGPSGPLPINQRNHEELIAEIVDMGIDEEDIEIAITQYGPAVISVETSVEDAADKGEEIVAVVERIFGRTEIQGIWFTHSNCLAVLTEARKQAMDDAALNAESLASAAGGKVGSIIAVTDAPAEPYGPVVVSPCSEDLARSIGLGGPYAGVLQPLGAEPEFTVDTVVSVTYLLEGS